MANHSSFILSPIENILYDVAGITRAIGGGIATYPIWEYVLESVFLKMTGAQEQKMKCICWEIASVDFEIRRDIYVKWDLGECSTLKHKRAIFKYLSDAMKKVKKDFDIESAIDLSQIFNDTQNIINHFYEESGIKGFMGRAFAEYKTVYGSIGPFCLSSQLIFNNCDNCSHNRDTGKPFTCSVKKGLAYMYGSLYNHRNRCAHNILSYQQNRPSLDTLYENDSIYENYFIRFSLLIMIDKILISLFKSFKAEIDTFKLF